VWPNSMKSRNASARKPPRLVGNIDVILEVCVGLIGLSGLGLDRGPVALGEPGRRVDDVVSKPGTDGEDRAWAVPGAHEYVLGPGRAVHEVPGLQRPLLALDQQQALTGENEKILLLILAVVEAAGCPGASTPMLIPTWGKRG
jgi:hypothetical protein